MQKIMKKDRMMRKKNRSMSIQKENEWLGKRLSLVETQLPWVRPNSNLAKAVDSQTNILKHGLSVCHMKKMRQLNIDNQRLVGKLVGTAPTLSAASW
jgi:DNA-directed RNA polymerase subunit H (RpoH/RPB5)